MAEIKENGDTEYVDNVNDSEMTDTNKDNVVEPIEVVNTQDNNENYDFYEGEIANDDYEDPFLQ